jgi:hypothetical protein
LVLKSNVLVQSPFNPVPTVLTSYTPFSKPDDWSFTSILLPTDNEILSNTLGDADRLILLPIVLNITGIFSIKPPT